MEEYKTTIEGFELVVKITGKVKPELYGIDIPEIKEGTRTILDSIKKSVVSELKLSVSELTDPREMLKLKQKIKNRLSDIVSKKIPRLTKEVANYLTIKMLNDMVGLGDVEFLLTDNMLEEVIIHKVNHPVMVYHKKHGWLSTNIIITSDEQIRNYAALLARRVGKQITALNPLLDANMLTGDRANAVLYPIAHTGNTITIRKFASTPWTIVDFIKSNTLNSEIAALMWLGVQYEMNILISGGTASGKTSLLNVMLQFMPSNHRIISIEDTRELQLPKTLFYLPMVTRSTLGENDISMQALLVNSLRMRPDRIILGEIRKGEDAQVLFEAMHTGHSVAATVHADTSFETIRRLINPPINIHANLLESVDLNFVMFRDRRKNIRKLLQVAEYLEEESDKVPIKANIIYRWETKSDTLKTHNAPRKIFEKLSTHTSMSLEDIKQDLAEKQKILEWLVSKEIRDIDEIGQIIKDYYSDPKIVMDKIK